MNNLDPKLRFNEVRIYAHQRSGSNYLAELIDSNFIESGSYKNVYGGHALPSEVDIDNPSIGYIYLYRDFDKVAQSVFKLRNTFGLDVNDYNRFLDTRYSEMFNPHLKAIHQVKHHNGMKYESRVSEYFRNIHMTPREFYDLHISAWENYSESENILVISYEGLTGGFGNTMLRISDFLGAKISEFSNISEKVGYLPIKGTPKSMLFSIYNQNILPQLIKLYHTIKKLKTAIYQHES
ncbi:MAG: sulfotransferase domain-containing protein [Bacteroidota bacterium]